MRRSELRLTPKQANIYAWGWQPQARFRDAVCGRRFGKTYLGVAEILRAARLAKEWQVPADDEIWYAAPTFRQARRVFWRRLKNALPTGWLAGRANETECSLPLKSGHVIRLVGLDAFDNLRGSGLFFVLVDEWADCPYAAWEAVLRPMLSTCRYVVHGQRRHGGHALRLGTPRGFNHCYASFLAGQAGGAADHRSWIYTSLAGGNVPAAEIAAARASMDPRTFRQEYEASFEHFAGRVYYAFERSASVRACAVDPLLPLHIGMDFNINPMSAVVLQEQAGGELWLVDEIVLPTSNTGEMADEIALRFGRPGFEPGQLELGHVTIYPDPAGAQRRTSAQGKTDISILREKGFRVLALEAHPLVRDRINLVNSRFLSADGTRSLFVDPRCHRTIECLEKLCYRAGSNEPDKASGFDHLPDALGYFLYTKHSSVAPKRSHVLHMSR
jgi:hypothetical protein